MKQLLGVDNPSIYFALTDEQAQYSYNVNAEEKRRNITSAL
ncbi:MAG: hypothetical protein RHS_2242 [Robinsoniella sp. RHS]|nr:MAG: hypothetical protein RHS_2242 [Robinsoniella sp. RHS]